MTNYPAPFETATGPTQLAVTATVTNAATPKDDRDEHRDRSELSRGDFVGRYVVLARIGQGGMGAVYAAYDPELDRKVALKLLLRTPGGSAGEDARLLREAQAMAQLSHPNVVTVHDVGALAGRVWIAMEFVDGQTLAAWLKDPRRGWRERLAAFLRAGEGLQAAHAAGLVHRDFKPDNVMLGADERVRVMDFGLVRAERLAGRPSVPFEHRGQSPLDMELTSAGTLLGTPRYMAPEQWTGGETDARTDQFAFCVALWEALHRQAPFAGADVFELSRAVTRGTIRPPPSSARVPAWIRRALLRGFAVDPAQRWPSMAALLAELRRDPTRHHRLIGAAAAAMLALGATLGWQRIEQTQQIAACDAAGREIEAVWSPDTRVRARASVLATGASFAETSFARAAPWLDDFARQWSDARRLNCLRGSLTDAPDIDLLRHADACLDERRAELGEIVRLIEAKDRPTVARALAAAPALTSPQHCVDLSRLHREATATEATGDEADALRRKLATAAALNAAGHHEAAAAEGVDVARDAAALGAPVLAARAQLGQGQAAMKLGELDTARARFEAAFHGALAVGADAVAARAASLLGEFVGLQQAHPNHPAAREWLAIAETLLTRLGVSDDDLQWAAPQKVRCRIHLRRAEAREAIACSRHVLDIQRRSLGREHPALASAMLDLGVGQARDGQLAGALDTFRGALAVQEDAFGLHHAELSGALERIGTTLQQMGANDDAIAALQRAVTVREQSQGPDVPELGNLLGQLSFVQSMERRYEDALRNALRGLAIQEKRLGPDHLHLGVTLNSAAAALRFLGRLDEALAHYQRALAIVEKAESPNPDHLEGLLTSIGRVYRDMDAYDEALASFRRIIAIKEAQGDMIGVAYRLSDASRVHLRRRDYDAAIADAERALALLAGDSEAYARSSPFPLLTVARARIGLGQPDAALALCERALAVIAADDAARTNPDLVGEAQFTCADALWNAGHDRPRAVDLAHRARAQFKRGTIDSRSRAAELEDWLAKHDGTR